jgi:hypothetical protein
MTINFEEDQQKVIRKTDNIQSLADQVEKLEDLQKRLELQEDNLKNTKKTNRSFIWRSNSYYDV